MEIKFDTPQLKELLSQAVLASLDTAKRDMLIQGAIQHLLTKDNTRSYGGSASPLEQAFQWAVRDVAQKMALDVLTNDAEFTGKVRALLTDAVVLLTETNREATVTKLADAIATGMAYRDR